MDDGDVVLFNRQPSLHKMSIMAHHAKVLNDGDVHERNNNSDIDVNYDSISRNDDDNNNNFIVGSDNNHEDNNNNDDDGYNCNDHRYSSFVDNDCLNLIITIMLRKIKIQIMIMMTIIKMIIIMIANANYISTIQLFDFIPSLSPLFSHPLTSFFSINLHYR